MDVALTSKVLLIFLLYLNNLYDNPRAQYYLGEMLAADITTNATTEILTVHWRFIWANSTQPEANSNQTGVNSTQPHSVTLDMCSSAIEEWSNGEHTEQ